MSKTQRLVCLFRSLTLTKHFVVETVYICELRDLSIKQLPFCAATEPVGVLTGNTVNTVWSL